MESYWDLLPSELHNEIYRQEHKSNMSQCIDGIRTLPLRRYYACLYCNYPTTDSDTGGECESNFHVGDGFICERCCGLLEDAEKPFATGLMSYCVTCYRKMKRCTYDACYIGRASKL